MDTPLTPGPASAGPCADRSRAALLRHFDAGVREAHGRFLESGDPAAADAVVLAVVVDHLPEGSGLGAAALEDDVALVAGLGLDSISLTEMIFLIEELMGVSVSNDELRGLRTVGDLRAFVRRKTAAVRASVPAGNG